MSAILLELNEVSFEYKSAERSFIALQNVNLSVNSGEFVAIIGPSGSGKSTLLNLLGLLARPTSGAQRVFGQALESLDDTQLASLRNTALGFVFQNFALVNRLTVLENILLPTTFLSDQEQLAAPWEEKALALLERFGLRDLAPRFPNELSGGQKQRVALCRALIMDPMLLLADEPTGALDSKSSKEVMAILNELNAEGRTIIVITHDPGVAAEAQRIVTLRDGKIASDEMNIHLKNPLAPFAQGRARPKAQLARDNSQRALKRGIGLLRASLLLARRSLAANRTRSILTGLGLFMGILSLIIIDGLGEIVEHSFNKLFFTSSVRKAYIYYDEDRTGPHGRRNSNWAGLDAESEFPKLAQMFEKKGIVRPFLRTSTCQIKTETGGFRSRIVGVSDLDEFIEMDTPLGVGRFPGRQEFTETAAVTVLGSDTINQLFDKSDPRRREKNFPIGERVVVDNCNTLGTFTIIGVLKKRDTSFGNRDANDVLYVPNQALLARMGPTVYRWFSVLPHPGVDTKNLATEISNFLSLRSGGRLTFASSVPADILERVRGFLRIVQTIVGFIGLLCLFVGGVGIMNMMLVTVAERTREIGVMKSLGANQGHIRSYILTEASLLCVIAGVVAVVCGLLVNNVFSLCVSLFVPMLKEFRWVFAPVGLSAGLLVSLLCGLGFGMLPASRAAKLDPAECLRSE
jgi:macrolide transport system ATP-binding/permease protein